MSKTPQKVILPKIVYTIVIGSSTNIRAVYKATVTPDRTISGSYDWMRLGQGATDRQCLLRSPSAIAYPDRSLRVVALSQTIGEYRWQELEYLDKHSSANS